VTIRRDERPQQQLRATGGPRAATLDDLRDLAAIKAVVSGRAYGTLMSSEELRWWLDAACSPDHFAAAASRRSSRGIPRD
jgi:hypothetical protein